MSLRLVVYRPLLLRQRTNPLNACEGRPAFLQPIDRQHDSLARILQPYTEHRHCKYFTHGDSSPIKEPESAYEHGKNCGNQERQVDRGKETGLKFQNSKQSIKMIIELFSSWLRVGLVDAVGGRSLSPAPNRTTSHIPNPNTHPRMKTPHG